jgi:hypothetical protein
MTWNEYKRCLTLRYDQFIAEHQIGRDQIDKDVRYEKITDVDRVQLGDDQHFYFKDGGLKMIYLSEGRLATTVWTEFKSSADASASETVVRSRAGKTANQVVFAEQGITASVQGNDVNFVEIYPPQSLEEYLATIYREPMPFIR